MPHKYFEQTRIRKLVLPTSFDTNKIQIGIPVDADEAAMVGLHNIGESVLPSPNFGCVSKRNACGDEYADKSQPKKGVILTPYGYNRLETIMHLRLRSMFIKNVILR